MAVAPIPPQYGSLTAYLILPDCENAIEFYKTAFGAEETVRMPMPDGKIGHAELKIGDRFPMMADANDTYPATGALLCLCVEDCDAVFAQAAAVGATVQKPLTDEFYGDRAGSVVDPFSTRWSIMTHEEDVSPDEMNARMAKMLD